ncbi:MAG TPA: DUF3006 domain-containing protein [Clostridiaceae bacterium]|jgi:hypothetical protein|nr:DUF3006 domain-containing protein [Clostridiaceae bacterium]HBG39393.1 DUF3006 domain-containing protein [Clostridiaceae bacterium]HBN28112.1 DUF3006 domain-containing protein [Clostridiaceae bacterium]HBX48612.1 DUF3006 domain-containing protein [Clostridiaceae bacterium]HCL49954.1 DUF3006 domain-containing protein [Clostridiaceae bacterium]
MKGVIDRFEGLFAVIVLDSGDVTDIEKSKIPEGAKEGDVVIIDDSIHIDREETEKRKKKMENYLKMWED